MDDGIFPGYEYVPMTQDDIDDFLYMHQQEAYSTCSSMDNTPYPPPGTAATSSTVDEYADDDVQQGGGGGGGGILASCGVPWSLWGRVRRIWGHAWTFLPGSPSPRAHY